MNKLYWIVCDDKETNVFEGRYQGAPEVRL